MRRAVIALAAIPFVVAVLACGAGSTGSSTSGGGGNGGTTAPAKNAPVTVKAGEPMTLTESVFGSKSVVAITLTNVKYNVKSGNQFVKATKGQFITADVTAEVKEGKFSINSSQFKLVAADGTAYDSTTMLDSKEISGSDLTAGQKTSGTIVFDAAAGAQTGGRIALKSWLAEGDAGYWTL